MQPLDRPRNFAVWRARHERRRTLAGLASAVVIAGWLLALGCGGGGGGGGFVPPLPAGSVIQGAQVTPGTFWEGLDSSESVASIWFGPPRPGAPAGTNQFREPYDLGRGGGGYWRTLPDNTVETSYGSSNRTEYVFSYTSFNISREFNAVIQLSPVKLLVGAPEKITGEPASLIGTYVLTESRTIRNFGIDTGPFTDRHIRSVREELSIFDGGTWSLERTNIVTSELRRRPATTQSETTTAAGTWGTDSAFYLVPHLGKTYLYWDDRRSFYNRVPF